MMLGLWEETFIFSLKLMKSLEVGPLIIMRCWNFRR